MALARMWAGAVIRKSGAIHKPNGSDTRKRQFECDDRHTPRVVGNKKIHGVQKTDRIDKIRKRAP